MSDELPERAPVDYKALSVDDAAVEISKRVYIASVGLLETLESAGKIVGAGEIAQSLAESASNTMKERWNK